MIFGLGGTAPPWKTALPERASLSALSEESSRAGPDWGGENPPGWRIIFQPVFFPFRSACFRFAGFAWTSKKRTVSRNDSDSIPLWIGFSIGHFQRLSSRQSSFRAKRYATRVSSRGFRVTNPAEIETNPIQLFRPRKAGTNFGGNFIPKTG